MLRDHPDRICAYFAVDYSPHLGAKIADAAQAVYERYSPGEVAARGPFLYLLRWPTERWFLTLGAQRIAWQCLGLSAWSDDLCRHMEIAGTVLSTIGIADLKRIGFKVAAYLPVEMSHPEMCDLMFGSFLAPADALHGLLGKPLDPVVQFEGERRDFKYVLVLSPMNRQQAVANLRAHKNLEHFLEDRFLDLAVKSFQERVSRDDCLFFDIDLFRNDVPATSLGDFARDSLTEAEQLADLCVRQLRSEAIPQGDRRDEFGK